MSDLKHRRGPLLAGVCLLLTLCIAQGNEHVPVPDLIAIQDTEPVLKALQIQAPVATEALQDALSALQGRPLDDVLLADTESLIRDAYAWLEWRDVTLHFNQPAEKPGVLQVTIRARPPVPDVVNLKIPKEAARPSSADSLPESYAAWLESPARVLVIAKERVMYFKHRKDVSRFSVAVGTERTPTPAGEYRVQAISHKPTWYPTRSIRRDHAARGIALPAIVPPGPGNPLGDWFVRLRDSIGIHGTDAPDSIGQASSYGCIRMRAEDIDRVARLLRRGDRVIVVDQLPQHLTLRE